MSYHPHTLPLNWWIYSYQADNWWIRAFKNLEEFQAAELQHDDYVKPERRECER